LVVTGPLPPARWMHQAAIYDGALIIHGGFDRTGGGNPGFVDVWRLEANADFTVMSWTDLSHPTPALFQGSFAVGLLPRATSILFYGMMDTVQELSHNGNGTHTWTFYANVSGVNDATNFVSVASAEGLVVLGANSTQPVSYGFFPAQNPAIVSYDYFDTVAFMGGAKAYAANAFYAASYSFSNPGQNALPRPAVLVVGSVLYAWNGANISFTNRSVYEPSPLVWQFSLETMRWVKIGNNTVIGSALTSPWTAINLVGSGAHATTVVGDCAFLYSVASQWHVCPSASGLEWTEVTGQLWDVATTNVHFVGVVNHSQPIIGLAGRLLV
jgi:hypothetical protein